MEFRDLIFGRKPSRAEQVKEEELPEKAGAGLEPEEKGEPIVDNQQELLEEVKKKLAGAKEGLDAIRDKFFR